MTILNALVKKKFQWGVLLSIADSHFSIVSMLLLFLADIEKHATFLSLIAFKSN